MLAPIDLKSEDFSAVIFRILEAGLSYPSKIVQSR